MYYGPELVADKFYDWCDDNGINVAYLEPGKLRQNGFFERINGSFRYKFLDAYLFGTLSQVLEMAWLWMLDHNDESHMKILAIYPRRCIARK